MKKTFIIFVIASLIILSIASCKTNKAAEEEGDETPPENTVYIYDDHFTPSTLSIDTANTEITWVNKGSMNHTVTSGTPSTAAGLSRVKFEKFGSATLSPGMTFKHSFQWEGDWVYYCTIHIQMRAVIKVKF